MKAPAYICMYQSRAALVATAQNASVDISLLHGYFIVTFSNVYVAVVPMPAVSKLGNVGRHCVVADQGAREVGTQTWNYCMKDPPPIHVPKLC
jgi:hypothetical protein